MNSLTATFGEGTAIEVFGKKFIPRHLDLNDLIEIEQELGSLESLDFGELRHLRLLLYIFLRKSDASLTAAQLEAEQWKMTEKQVGRMLTPERLAWLQTPDGVAFLKSVMVGAGLMKDGQEVGETQGNEPGSSG